MMKQWKNGRHPENQQRSIDDAGKIGKMYINDVMLKIIRKKSSEWGQHLKKKKKKMCQSL